MNRYRKDIREKTAGMSQKEKWEYIFTYYWYHFLGIAAVFALIIIFVGHFIFGEKKPLFTCVMINQAADDARDDRIADGFAQRSGLNEERIVIDSNYNFSYEGVTLQGANESFYDKFFLKWSNSELDAVILEESFYKFCKEMDGSFRNLDDFDTGTFTLYTDGGKSTAIVLEGQDLIQPLRDTDNEKLLLVFPNNGKHEEECQKFIDYIGSGVLSDSN